MKQFAILSLISILQFIALHGEELTLVLTYGDPTGVETTDVGQTAFNNLFYESPEHILYRYCPDCADGMKHIYYKRYTLLDSIDLYSLTTNWVSTNNVLGTDFDLYSSLEDALNDENAWTFCNYDDANVGMFRDCGPNGYIPWQWTSASRAGRKSTAFYIYTAPPFELALTYGEPTGVEPTDVGRIAFNNLFYSSSQHILYRYCPDCSAGFQDIYYKRYTLLDSIDLYSLTTNWVSTDNELGTDFDLFSSLDDALNEENAWSFCNYDDRMIGMFRDCGPNGYMAWQWTSAFRTGGKSVAFYIYDPQETPDPQYELELVLTYGDPTGVETTDIGQTAFNNLFHSSEVHILYRYCPDCVEGMRNIYYKRHTLLDSIDLYSLTTNWVSTNNILGTDFDLYSSLEEALNDENAWPFCNYDDANVGMFRDCGPYGYIAWQWTSRSRAGLKAAAFYIVVEGENSVIHPNRFHESFDHGDGYHIEISKPVFLAILGLIAVVIVMNFMVMCCKKNKAGNKGYGVVKHVDSDSEYA